MSGSNHIWNAIQTEDGQWYEIDVTWNDEMQNEYFMLKNHNSAPSSRYNPMAADSMDWWITENLY